MPWTKDRNLWLALFVGFLLRAVPLAVWYDDGCLRDECTYLKLALRLAEGEGMTSSVGWLWAPGYPFLLALHKWLLGYATAIKGTQVLAAGLNTVLVYILARRVFAFRPGGDITRRRARIAAWLYAASPHMAFFAIRLWSEVLYSTLLLAALLLLDRARRALVNERTSAALLEASAVGVAVGCCMLFRGVATYMLPIFAVGLLWRQWRSVRAWGQAALVIGVAAATVAPYSIYASQKFDAFVITDRTLGQMMWLGNNDFEPMAFDYGNGQLSKRAFARAAKLGRDPCGERSEAMDRDECQTADGVAWIKEHQGEFLRRMPLRMAQMMTPHSLLTRHLQWGRWKGMPWWMDEGIILWGALASMLAMLGGTLGLVARGRGGQGLVIAGILAYHAAAIAALAGLSRYRVPLEPLLMVYAAGLLAEPRVTWRALRASPWRMAGAVGLMGVTVPLVLWYLPAGWFQWRSW